ncbi:MAG: hypothetical protein RL346_90 [Verrucomicrobiota bacterium]
MSDSPHHPLEGLLDSFALGPAWARAKPTTGGEKKYRDHGDEPRRDFKKGRDNRNQRDDRRDDRRQGGGAGGGHRRFEKGGPRPEQRREEIAPAEGVSVTLVPDKTAIQLVCKEIHQVARVYPLFDVAEIILAERSRCRAVFEISEKQSPFYVCKLEDAIYLTKEEALQHFLTAEWRKQFIEESTIEIDPPKGNFQSIAKCGISGELLGPPNYHAYQSEIRRIHREHFSHMPLEAYMAKIRTERSEEAVNAWLDSMKIQTRWRIVEEGEGRDDSPQPPISATPPAEPAPAAMDESDESVQSDGSEASLEETAAVEAAAEETTAEEAAPVETHAPAPSDNIHWFTDLAEFERAIAAELLDKTFRTTRKVNVSAAISAKNLSPGLLDKLKATSNHIRKHAAILIPAICKALEAEHMAVFKRKGKLFTGPARPHALAPDAVLAPRPHEMVKWIRENSPAKLEGLWKAVLPEGATAPPAEYAADLFWLLQQGHILLYTDDTLVVQEPPKPQEPKKPKAPKENTPATEKPAQSATEDQTDQTSSPEEPDTSSPEN